MKWERIGGNIIFVVLAVIIAKEIGMQTETGAAIITLIVAALRELLEEVTEEEGEGLGKKVALHALNSALMV